MQLLRNNILISIATISFLSGLNGIASAASSTSFCGLKPGIFKSSQPLQGDEFIGASVSANPLHPKVEFNPRSAALHIDNANTRAVDYPGPLGRNLNITAIDIDHAQFFWDAKGTMFAAYGGPCNGSATNIVLALAVINPKTLDFEAVWELPAKYVNTSLNTPYMQLLMDTDEIVIGSAQGQIYVLQKSRDVSGSPSIELRRLIDLTPTGVLDGKALLNTMMDSASNIWFTTGVLPGVGDGPSATSSTIIGYIEPDGTIHSLEIPNQTVENGMAVSNTTVFVLTGPSGTDVHADAIGYVSAFQPGPGNSVHIKWNSTYQAGSGRKPGALSRGAGTTPGLLGNEFMTFADNADVQTNLLVYPQNASGEDIEPVCKFPLFQPNASWTDNSYIKHFDGKDYAVVVQNMYNDTGFITQQDINGLNNSFAGIAPGISKIFVAGDGSGCHLEWTNTDSGRMTTAPVLSTKTGLIYGYEQSIELAEEGEYVWYASAIDFKSGKTVWKARTGAGGSFNNNFKTTFLGPDGVLYQPMQNGVVTMKDGE